MKKIAIMQPTYLPWIGYFALMDRVDGFVFLDTVQFERRSWQQRNRIKTPQGAIWLTVPVHNKGLRDQTICQVEIDLNRGFPSDHVRALELNYSKTPYFSKYMPEICAIITKSHTLLSDLTIELILFFQKSLEISVQTIRSTNLVNVGKKADLLVNLCKQLDATVYVSPPGSRQYLEDSDAFMQENIKVVYHQYHHPQYTQKFGSFVPYLSIVDLLFNCGPDSLTVLREGVCDE
ncbi:hypothetical protein SIID45300_02706 [Candidatus Magnetaquicoccaceae bacterium FCR-1]|uniref:WbqC-like family protein n=1 Tax=Candidatus Magnetaquiglobus chichijimensis TaxID=3141448 RepID=A0ABQ0CBU3_9PROT